MVSDAGRDSSDGAAPSFLRERFSGLSGAGTAGRPNSVVCLVLSLFCPRPFEAPAVPTHNQSVQYLCIFMSRVRNDKTLTDRQTFPFPGFGRLGFIEEALALV